MVTFNGIEKQIIEALMGSYNKKGTVENWIEDVKQSLCATGHWGDKATAYDGERSYDLVWYDGVQHPGNALLVADFEVAADNLKIKDHFSNLLMADAYHRLMIFKAEPIARKQLIADFAKTIHKFSFSREKDRYLFAVIDEREAGNFVFTLLVKGHINSPEYARTVGSKRVVETVNVYF